MWSISEELIEDPHNCHHDDKVPTCASLGKAANGQGGSHHHNNPPNACPGKASNGKGSTDHCASRHHDNPSNACPGKASNGKRISNHLCNEILHLTKPKTSQSINPTPGTQLTKKGIPISDNGHQRISKIWPKNAMDVKSTSICLESLLFKFEMNGEAAVLNF
jgi:hypothetical protein